MKTIEERAWEKYPEVIKHHNLAQIDINEEKRRMYIEISTEQKAIDIKKAKKAFCDTCMGRCEDKTHCDTLQRYMNELEG